MIPSLPPQATAQATALASTRSHSLTTLLGRYVAGDVSPDALAAVCTLFDDTSATPTERLAFARFYLDALDGGDPSGDADAVLPRSDEWEEILGIARA